MSQAAKPFMTQCAATAAALLIYLLNSAFVTGVQLLGGVLALWKF